MIKEMFVFAQKPQENAGLAPGCTQVAIVLPTQLPGQAVLLFRLLPITQNDGRLPQRCDRPVVLFFPLQIVNTYLVRTLRARFLALFDFPINRAMVAALIPL